MVSRVFFPCSLCLEGVCLQAALGIFEIEEADLKLFPRGGIFLKNNLHSLRVG